MINKQAVFEQVAKHLLKQGRKAETSTFECQYLAITPGGEELRCAVGCLLAPDAAPERFEGISVGLPMAGEHETNHLMWALLRKELLRRDIDIAEVETRGFLQELQQLHDISEPQFWSRRLVGIAASHSLDASFITQEPPNA